ncbi:MAG: response regulator [Calditrichia bacterium]
MKQILKRSDQLAEKIYEIKLLIPEWKVLFALNGRKDAGELASFLEMETAEVEDILNRLQEQDLAYPEGAETDTEESTEEEVSEYSEEEDESLFAENEEEYEEPVDEMESEDEFFESEEDEQELDESGFEELSPEEEAEPREKEGDEDLDQLISDLLKEEGGENSESGTTDNEQEEEDISDDSGLETLSLEEEPDKEPESELQKTGEDEFDFSDLFQDELSGENASAETAYVETEEETETLPEKETQEAEASEERPEGDQKVILVVDDSVVIRKMVEIALENENYKIVAFPNGKDALSYLDEQEPDLVILDIMLPDMNGLDILKTIKASKELPVVMLSAKDTPRETGKARELGADDFIPKPFKDEELIEKIHNLIGE